MTTKQEALRARQLGERRAMLERHLRGEEDWMKSCGGTLTGYIQTYGSANEPGHYGDGGEAIYAADLGKVRQLEEQLADTQEQLVKLTSRN